MKFIKDTKVRNAIMIGSLCSVSYLAVYVARNILSAVSPQMIANDGFTNEYIGEVSALYFIFYAFGQLINGAIGDKIKARFMISFGLIFAGVTNLVFPYLSHTPETAKYIFGMTGFFLSMIYGPMTKVVAENTEPVYATRCSLGYTFASFLGSPSAGLLAAFLTWQSVFYASSVILFVMGAVCLILFGHYEKIGIVKYHQFDKPKSERKGGIKVLIKHRIIKFTLISVITGVVRTTVVFWLPTYIAQYLGFSAEQSASIFTVATLVISMTAFIAVFLYEKLGHDMDKTILIVFTSSAIFFMLVYLVKLPVLNIIFMVIAIMSSNAAASMLWSRYCPSLRDTGMVSGATGFLDFVSYMSASISSTIFANAATSIGWGNLILVWFGLMVFGIVVALPYDKLRKRANV
ncbi:MAG: MFS transporter [Lachnospiraceae bacterium]|nr:MFS transporter [Lachnospiraceae bacterium]